VSVDGRVVVMSRYMTGSAVTCSVFEVRRHGRDDAGCIGLASMLLPIIVVVRL
jgi:hypothetical protein